MDRNNWYSQQDYDPRRARGSPQAPVERVAVDSVQDAQTLLAVYPMASATPSNHGEPPVGPYYALSARVYADNMIDLISGQSFGWLEYSRGNTILHTTPILHYEWLVISSGESTPICRVCS